MPTFRTFLIALACTTALNAVAADAIKQLDVPAGDLTAALEMLAKQSGAELIYQTEQLQGLSTKGVSGALSPQDAVRKLIEGTKLTVRTDASGAMLITSQPARVQRDATATPATQTAAAQANATAPSARAAAIEEVIVTAQKREERLQDVPVPVTAISADTLVASNLVRVQDYYSQVPGLNLTPGDQSAQNLTIRGITTGFSNPTVGVTVDDVPYGSSLGVTGGLQVPDIDPSDLARIEVLRGPQGTLYGASSMGGLFKFVTVDPSTDGFSGRVQAGINGVKNGGDLGYGLRGAVNISITDNFAVRASAFTRHDPGYIDNIQTGEDGVDDANISGGRASALLRLSDDVSLKVGAVYQKLEGDGASQADVLPGLGDLQQDRLRGTGWYDRELQVYSAVLNAAFGEADFVAVTGYGISEIADTVDYTSVFGPNTLARFGTRGTPLRNDYKTKKFTQEGRLTVPLTDRIEWLLGGFYADERTRFGQSILAANTTTGALVGTFYTFSRPYVLTEYAAFTDVTFQISDRFDVQIGGRQSWQDQSSGPTPSLGFPPLGTGAAVVAPQLRTATDDVFTYLITPRFKISPDVMIYARMASGYRSGGGGTATATDRCVIFNYPCQYGPDKTQNYEAGIKGSTPDRVLSFDASVYYIDWKDIQIQVLNQAAGATYNTNGSRARSQGIELSLEANPRDGTTIAGWLSWNDAELTEAFPPGPVLGAKGDRLPLSSRFSGNISVDQQFDVTGDMTGSVGGTLTYMGARLGAFRGVPGRVRYPEYAKLDLRAGLQQEAWSFDAYVNNVTDKRAALSGGGTGPILTSGYIYIQPRTFGLSVTRTF